jgi:hypothetical protein
MRCGISYGTRGTLWSVNHPMERIPVLLVVLNHRDVERVGREPYNKRKQCEGRLYYS